MEQLVKIMVVAVAWRVRGHDEVEIDLMPDFTTDP
jgi:hypothetical protein